MLQMITKLLLNKTFKTNKTTDAANIIWKNQVYPIYIMVRNKFIFCMQHKLLKRQDILDFKLLLNKSINKKKYARIKFKNDCHEIYSKLKDNKISKQQMLTLNKFLDQFTNQS